MTTQLIHRRDRLASFLPPVRGAILAMAIAVAFTGCAVVPHPMTTDEQTAQLKHDRENMFNSQEAVAKPITISEAMARAIKYNLDHRVKLMEEAVSQRQLDLSNYDLLPRLTLAAGYVGRDSYSAASSRDVFTGIQTLSPSTSQDKQRRVADLGFTWNILDFGVSYYQSQQQADRTLVMKERRRKVVHSLMQQVRQAYWLALGAQQMEVKVIPLLKEVEQALADSRNIQQEKLRAPLETLNYQRQLLDTMRQLEAIRDELGQAKPRLASLMNLDPSQPFELATGTPMTVPTLRGSLPAMEQAALLNRPELIEARYNERIGVNETKKAMAKLMPGIEFSLGAHYDSNSFLVDNRWTDTGLRVTWNIFNLLSAPKIMETAEAQVEVARMQRMALNMAVLSQVYVAYRDYQGRQRQYALSANLDELDRKILEQTRNATRSDAQGKLTEIRASVSAMLSELRMQQSYGALHNAYGAMLATLGVDPIPEEVPAHDIASLAKVVATADSRGWDAAPAVTPTPKANQ